MVGMPGTSGERARPIGVAIRGDISGGCCDVIVVSVIFGSAAGMAYRLDTCVKRCPARSHRPPRPRMSKRCRRTTFETSPRGRRRPDSAPTPIVGCPAARPRGYRPFEGPAMKLITWNIQWGRGADGRVDLDRIVAHARGSPTSTCCACRRRSAGYPELPGCDGGDQFARLHSFLPGTRRSRASRPTCPHPAGWRRRFGNIIFTCMPVLQVFRHLLPWPADPGVKSMPARSDRSQPAGTVRSAARHDDTPRRLFGAAARRAGRTPARAASRGGRALAQQSAGRRLGRPVRRACRAPPHRSSPAIATSVRTRPRRHASERRSTTQRRSYRAAWRISARRAAA